MESEVIHGMHIITVDTLVIWKRTFMAHVVRLHGQTRCAETALLGTTTAAGAVEAVRPMRPALSCILLECIR